MDEALRDRIIDRDGGCVARFAGNRLWRGAWPMFADLPYAGPCRDGAGRVISPYAKRYMTIDEVKIDQQDMRGSHYRMAKKAGYSLETCIAACPGHHVFGRQWSTTAEAREAIRLYLIEANAPMRRST